MIRIVDILKKVGEAKEPLLSALPAPIIEPKELIVQAAAAIVAEDFVLLDPLIGKIVALVLAGDKNILMTVADPLIKKAVLTCQIGVDAGYDQRRLAALFFSIIVKDTGSSRLKEAAHNGGHDLNDKNFDKAVKSAEIFLSAGDRELHSI